MKTRLFRIVALACAGLLAAGAALAEGKKKGEMTPLDVPTIGDIQMLKPGDAAPGFKLEDLAGKTFDFEKSAPQKVHMLVFWSIFCEPCKAEMPLIQRIYDQYKEKGLEILAIAMDGEPMKKSIQALVRQQGYSFRVLIDKLAPDETFVVADPYGVAGTPTIYLVDRKGKIAFGDVGTTSKDVLEEAIRKVLDAK